MPPMFVAAPQMGHPLFIHCETPTFPGRLSGWVDSPKHIIPNAQSDPVPETCAIC